jgi:hypothetical protein
MTFQKRYRIFRVIVKPAELWQALCGWLCGVEVTVTDEQSNDKDQVLSTERRRL